ncbi:MAG: carbonic anhydrase, partial [Thermoplasmata archaeon]|nr:carbonic anhydrase [Thermoplasmata archaeon]
KMKPVEVMNELMEGNGRFVADNASELKMHVGGQSPKAAILSCADSRVIPEIIFDQWIGDIFVVRAAGNVAFDAAVLQSLEYAVVKLKVPLLLILGHTGCGAVALAENCLEVGCEDGGPLVDEIAASFELGDNHEMGNVRRQLKMLPIRSEAIANAVSSGELALMGAMYDLETGNINLI